MQDSDIYFIHLNSKWNLKKKIYIYSLPEVHMLNWNRIFWDNIFIILASIQSQALKLNPILIYWQSRQDFILVLNLFMRMFWLQFWQLLIYFGCSNTPYSDYSLMCIISWSWRICDLAKMKPTKRRFSVHNYFEKNSSITKSVYFKSSSEKTPVLSWMQ